MRRFEDLKILSVYISGFEVLFCVGVGIYA